MVKVLFPNFFMRLMFVNVKKAATQPFFQATFSVPPKMTKTEVKEYLTKIYNIPVVKVNTANVLGKFKRLYARRRVIGYKRRNSKLAYVDLNYPAEEVEKFKQISKHLR